MKPGDWLCPAGETDGFFQQKLLLVSGPQVYRGGGWNPHQWTIYIHVYIYLYIYIFIYLFILSICIESCKTSNISATKRCFFFFGGIGQAKPCILWDVTGIYISFGCVWNWLWCTPVYHMKNRKHVAFFSFFSTHTHTGSQTFELMQTLLDLWKHMYGSGLF